MALQLSKDNPRIFRITHIDNIPWILENGLHARNGEKFDPKYRNIGNLDLIAKRSTRAVGINPFGVLDDYIPFYFTPYSIMLYNIHTGCGVSKVPNDEIVIMVADLKELADNDARFVFTNQHAYPATTEYFNQVSSLDQIDWNILQARDFRHDPYNDPGRKERYQAEALIWKHLPLSSLKGLCCYSKKVEVHIQRQVEALKLNLKVAAQPLWYF